LNAPLAASASVRAAAIGDLPRIVAIADAIFRPEPRRPGLGSMAHDYPLLFDPDNAANLVVAERDGALVAHAGFTLREAMAGGVGLRVACFGSVFTSPGQEGLGHATAALAEAIVRARAAGADLGLVSGARGLYARAGFRPYPACRRWRVPRGEPAPALVVERFTPAVLPAVAALYAAEPVRFARPEADWRRLLAAGVLFYDPATIFTVARGGPIVGYLALAHRGGDGGYRALELAGDRAAVAAAVPAVAAALGVATIDVVAPEHDEALASVALGLGWWGEAVRFRFGGICWNPALAGLPWPWYGLNYV
jgi:predicted N-acetyltransferase YhbS